MVEYIGEVVGAGAPNKKHTSRKTSQLTYQAFFQEIRIIIVGTTKLGQRGFVMTY